MRLRFLFCAFCALSISVARAAPLERVLIAGEQAGGTEIPYSTGLTVSRAIIAAGGYSDFSRTPFHLVRGGEVTRIDMRAILELGQREKDISLKPWHIIVIGTRLKSRR